MNLNGNLNLSSIVKCDFPQNQYFPIDHPKSQIVLHHSAGWDNARGMFNSWAMDKPRVATCCGIVDDGTVLEIFDPKFWAYHVNVESRGNAKVKEDPRYKIYCERTNAISIENRTVGVEVCNWGGLTLIDGKFHTWASKSVINKPGYDKEIIVNEKRVIEYSETFRGSRYFERYTDAEIESLWKLIRHWSKLFDIPTELNGNIFDINEFALRGTRGIYTHCSYRIDKQDIHPQPGMIEMLHSL